MNTYFVALTLAVCVGVVLGSGDSSKWRFATKAVHSGTDPEHNNWAVVPPISLATTYIQSYPGNKPGLDDPKSYGNGYFYSRQANPTRGALEIALAALEDSKYCATFASGMAASHATLQLLNGGDHVIASNDLYGGTSALFRTISNPSAGIEYTFTDMNDFTAIEAAITPKTRMLWIETLTNPLMQTFDIRKLSAIAKKHNLLLVVDNTFMSPVLAHPLELGADVVIHSLTKYIAGHSDVLMGAAMTNNDDIIKRFRLLQNYGGAVPSPFESYLALRGLKTLPLRLEYSQKTSLAVAQAMETHPVVEKVVYPGLASYPQKELFDTQATGAGAMMALHIKGGLPVAARFLQSLKIFGLAVSLGAVESLACSPALMTHTAVPRADREAIGLTDSLIRISVGVEHPDDLVEDINQALDAAFAEYTNTK